MHQEHLAIASVPMQSWGAIYDPQKALLIGTIFQDLNLPFYLAEESGQLQEMPQQTPTRIPSPTSPGISSPVSPGVPGSVPEIPIQEPGKTMEVPLNTPGKSEEQEKRETLLCQINAVCFALDDLRLYMDTHPKDKSCLELLKDAVKTRRSLLKDFADQFYPLTMDCMADIYEENPASECYCWEKGPLPWEGACV